MHCRPVAPVVWLKWPQKQTRNVLEGLVVSVFRAEERQLARASEILVTTAFRPSVLPSILTTTPHHVRGALLQPDNPHSFTFQTVYHPHLQSTFTGTIRCDHHGWDYHLSHFPDEETELLVRRELPACRLPAQKLSKHSLISSQAWSCLCPSISNKISKEQQSTEQTLWHPGFQISGFLCLFADPLASLFLSFGDSEKYFVF